MAKQVLNNGETHGSIRNKVNGNFDEVYSHMADYAAYGFKINNDLSSSDLNLQGDVGFYRLISGNTNIPSGFNGYGILAVQFGKTGYLVQEIAQVLNGRKWVRCTSQSQSSVKSGTATWTDWVRVYTSNEIKEGAGSPEGAVAASVGDLYRRTDSGDLYVKKTGTGNTGWGKVTVA